MFQPLVKIMSSVFNLKVGEKYLYKKKTNMRKNSFFLFRSKTLVLNHKSEKKKSQLCLWN